MSFLCFVMLRLLFSFSLTVASFYEFCSSPRKRVIRDALVNTAIVRSDAAWAEQRNCAGLGWVLFAEDQIIQFSEQKAFVISPLIAEGLAVREAVLTCQRRELKKVRIESDSQTLVKALNSGASGAGLYGIVSDILKMAEAFEYVCFVWIPRERNVMADCLAKTALNVVVPLVVGEAFIASN